MSISRRLVTQRRKFGRFDLLSIFTSIRTFSRGDGIPVVLGHSSRASIIRYVGDCPGTLSMSSRH